MRKFTVFLSVFVILVISCCVSASAQSYSTDYPNVFNSGSPLWFTCTVDGEQYVVLLDPDTNPQSFGFDNPSGYNLINNTGSNINGRAYNVNNSSGYLVRFPSYYGMQFREPGSSVTNQWRDVYITDIDGSTLDFIDYNGTRGNDLYKHDIAQRDYFIIISVLLFAVVLLFVISIVFKPKLFRM